jgi:hypothetical protein
MARLRTRGVAAETVFPNRLRLRDTIERDVMSVRLNIRRTVTDRAR